MFLPNNYGQTPQFVLKKGGMIMSPTTLRAGILKPPLARQLTVIPKSADGTPTVAFQEAFTGNGAGQSGQSGIFSGIKAWHLVAASAGVLGLIIYFKKFRK